MVLPLEDEAGQPMGLLAVGNTEKMAAYQTCIEVAMRKHDGGPIVALITATAWRAACLC